MQGVERAGDTIKEESQSRGQMTATETEDSYGRCHVLFAVLFEVVAVLNCADAETIGNVVQRNVLGNCQGNTQREPT